MNINDAHLNGPTPRERAHSSDSGVRKGKPLLAALTAGSQRYARRLAGLGITILAAGAIAASDPADASQSGEEIYASTCAHCHEGGVAKAPHKTFLSMMSADSIFNALETGVMQTQASSLSEQEKATVAEFLSGSTIGDMDKHLEAAKCNGDSREFDLTQPPGTHGWGFSRQNTRYIPGDVAQLPPQKVERLKLKWAFGFPGASRARSQPTVAMGAVFVGSQDGTVYALDRETGCVRWTFRASAEVRTPVIIESWEAGSEPSSGPTAYFADLIARVYAVDAQTGELKWMIKADEHPNATITGAPVLYEGRLYVPISSLEVSAAAEPDYPCCSFRGSVVTLDAASGEQVWKSYTIAEKPSLVGKTRVGTPIYAPSGAPIWNSPLLDPERGLLYVGTGENYSSPANETSDALMAFRMSDGELQWVRQTTKGDAWNSACMMPDNSNCPEENGPDVDFGAALIKVTLPSGKDLLLAGQKSGVVYGLDPDKGGEIVWQKKVGRGGIQGGVHFGMAAGEGRLYVPISDMSDKEAENYAWNIPGKPGIYALDPATGELLWEHRAPNICGDKKYCEPGISASITAIPGVVLAGHMDGQLKAYAAEDGKLLWKFATDEKTFATVNGVPASGGSFGGSSGAYVHGGMLFVNSGYGMYYHRPGNVLLAFEPE